ncbi:hypothetical protein ABEB36_004474 [Hypothenemus hampei]|uniref:Uncharacterized protein n=1 Tax=Hypothenemus hampei TaxID=57062 RepID=A0ABD1F3G4_HYPHA
MENKPGLVLCNVSLIGLERAGTIKDFLAMEIWKCSCDNNFPESARFCKRDNLSTGSSSSLRISDRDSPIADRAEPAKFCSAMKSLSLLRPDSFKAAATSSFNSGAAK